MAVNLSALEQLAPVAACKATAPAAIKKPGETTPLLLLDAGATVAGVFTRNAFAAAPGTLPGRGWPGVRRWSTAAMPTPAPAACMRMRWPAASMRLPHSVSRPIRCCRFPPV